MPEYEQSDERLAKEAQVLLGGGTASTARTLGFISYYILANPEIHSRLQEELKDPMSGWPDRVPSWAELERLPFLQSLIKEGLRWARSTHQLGEVATADAFVLIVLAMESCRDYHAAPQMLQSSTSNGQFQPT